MKKSMISTIIVAVMALGLVSNQVMAAKPQARCKVCHTFKEGGKHKIGPNLFAIVGRPAGSTDFKRYSKALKKGGWTWNEDNLQEWLCDTRKAIKKLSGDDHAKSKMPPQKICGEKAETIISFLETLK